jgi:hypothetical protein
MKEKAATFYGNLEKRKCRRRLLLGAFLGTHPRQTQVNPSEKVFFTLFGRIHLCTRGRQKRDFHLKASPLGA